MWAAKPPTFFYLFFVCVRTNVKSLHPKFSVFKGNKKIKKSLLFAFFLCVGIERGEKSKVQTPFALKNSKLVRVCTNLSFCFLILYREIGYYVFQLIDLLVRLLIFRYIQSVLVMIIYVFL